MIKKVLYASAVVMSLFFSAKPCVAQILSGSIVHEQHIETGLYAPIRVAVDKSDNIYVTETAQKRVTVFDAAGNFVEDFAVSGRPVGIAVNSKDELYVGMEDGRIMNVSSGVESLFFEDNMYPADMDFGPNDVLYIADQIDKCVKVIDISGQGIINRIGEGTIVFPSSVSYDHENSRVVVSEQGGEGPNSQNCGGMMGAWGPVMKVYLYETDGTFISEFGCHGNTNGKFERIQGLTMGDCGNIYINDSYQGRVSVFSKSGVYITHFGEWGDSISQLMMPMDVIFDSKGRLIIPVTNNSAIELFTLSDSLPRSIISNSDATFCAGGSADVEITFTGTAPWTFSYTRDGIDTVTVTDNYDNPYVFNVMQGGKYEVVDLSDANYSANCFTGSANINVITETPTSNITNADTTICNGFEATIPVELTGSAPWQITYTVDGVNPETILTAQNPYMLKTTQAGVYQVTELSSAGCIGSAFSGSATVTVKDRPTAGLLNGVGPIELCEGDAVSLFVQFSGEGPWGFTYTIDGENETIVSSGFDNPYALTAADQGVYQITQVRDASCNSSEGMDAHTELIVHQRPTAHLMGTDTMFCSGGYVAVPIDLTGQAPWSLNYSYNSNGSTTINNTYWDPVAIYAIQEGDYHINWMHDARCDAVDITGQFNVTHYSEPPVNFSTDGNICEGDVLTLDPGVFESYQWFDASTGQTVEVSSAGVYSVTVTDANACVGEGQVTVTLHSLPEAFFTFVDDSVEVTFSNNSVNADSYFWDFGDSQTSTESDPYHIYNTNGSYVVSLTATNAYCGDSTYTDTVTVYLVSINESVVHDYFKVYPNPTSGLVYLEFSQSASDITLLEIFDVSGRKVYSADDFAGEKIEQVDLTGYSEGVYTLRFVHNNEPEIAKIIIKK